MQRRFAIYDVFSDRPLAGNKLGVVLDCAGLDTPQMQAIAREFNFSETVFLMPPEDANHSARMRIFVPKNELPFAGHPTVGGAVAVAVEKGLESVGQGIVVLEENIGPVRCAVRFGGTQPYAEFDLPILASSCPGPQNREAIAAALSIDSQDIGFENHIISNYDGGLPYTLVPVRDLSALSAAKPVLNLWNDGFGVHDHNSAYVYCRETGAHNNHFRARMFAPDAGIPEDPATGSAVASLAGALIKYDDLRDGLHTCRIEQGIEMGRPSLIILEIEIRDGRFVGGRIGGHAAEFARGTIDV